ncbi:MAG: SgcJ/EcaC family oxidoreductase [Acetobacteraceae bacterium]|nr:SgcJ/EcaC family oxidoreductase [Acetobacteraceae bacterium]MBV8522618.1 SgcJ/EcaC family oxidoreductase [Acetobacteraceae bacterium]MBV8590186.1 SgcJ/EcaC family oxidoreductase [Acetobacteraceae bacterium]
MKRNLVRGALFLLVGLAAPALAQQDAAERPHQVVDALTTKLAQAYNSHDAAGVASLYTEDGVYITPEGIVQGRDAIRKTIEDELKTGGNLTIKVSLARAYGDAIWSAGEWSEAYSGESDHGYWSYVVVRQGDDYKIRYDTYNIGPAAPAQPPAHK